jgi:hypothetical protein
MDGNEEEEIEKTVEDDIIFSEAVLDSFIINAISFLGKKITAIPLRISSLLGALYMHELLTSGHDGRIKKSYG